MMKYVILLTFLILPLGTAFGAEQPAKACSGEKYKALDFWLGDWRVSWKGGEGTNNISKSHGGCVVNENFTGPKLHGMSISMYVKATGQWRQTWMDNQGSFFDFYGYTEGDNYIFHTMTNPQKPDIQLRMIFTDIKANSLTWLWQKTSDGGKSWQEKWKINYSREK